jgi:hypothetical protein
MILTTTQTEIKCDVNEGVGPDSNLCMSRSEAQQTAMCLLTEIRDKTAQTLVRRPVLMLNRISLLIMVSDLRKPVRDCCRSVQRKTAIRTSPAAATAFTDIDNGLSSVSCAKVVKLILNWSICISQNTYVF